jgi:hypothetical protein
MSLGPTRTNESLLVGIRNLNNVIRTVRNKASFKFIFSV